MYLLKQGCKRQRNATDRDKFRLHFAFFAFSRGNNHPMNQRINHSTARRYALPCRRKFAQAADNLGVVQRGLARLCPEPVKEVSRRNESAWNDFVISREFEPTTPKMRLEETLALTP